MVNVDVLPTQQTYRHIELYQISTTADDVIPLEQCSSPLLLGNCNTSDSNDDVIIKPFNKLHKVDKELRRNLKHAGQCMHQVTMATASFLVYFRRLGERETYQYE